MKNIFLFVLLIYTIDAIGQGASVVYDPAQYGNMVKQITESTKQTAQQEKMVIETTKQTVTAKAMSGDINKILSMQQDALNAMNRYSQIITFDPTDFVCMLEKMAIMFKNQLPKIYLSNFENLLKFNCQRNASKLYNIINPYNAYARTTSEKTNTVYNSNSSADYYKTVKESKEVNLSIVELSNKNKIEMAGMYDKMGDEKIQQAKKMTLEINTVQQADVKLKMQQDLDRLMREGMEYKQKSLDLMVEVGNSNNKYQEAEKSKEKARFTRKEIAKVEPMRYGIW